MISLPGSHPSRNPHRTSRWTVFLAAVASLLFLPAIGSADGSADKRATLPGGDVEAAREKAHATIRTLLPACTYGTATFNQTINGTLTSTDCSSTDSSGTLYADFYAFNATAGHTVTVTAHSSLLFLASVQDYSSGTVLASSGSCGLTDDTCSFTYVIPSSGTYLMGFGAYGFGSYTLTLTDSGAAVCGDSRTLCLSNSTYAVTVVWATTDGRTGSGNAVTLTSDTGYFWFFSSANVELVIKVLDGRGINGKHWVFYGALSDVTYTITVTNRVTGVTRTYTNVQGNLASVADTSAFDN
jgi:hypothetical protein